MLNLLARDPHNDVGDLLLLKEPIRDAADRHKAARDLLGGNVSHEADLIRALLISQFAISDTIQRILDRIPSPPIRTFTATPCLNPECGGDYAAHDARLDLKPSDGPPLGRIHFFGPPIVAEAACDVRPATAAAPRGRTSQNAAAAPGEVDAETGIEAERAAHYLDRGDC